MLFLIFSTSQDPVSCQVSFFVHWVYCLQQKIPVPDAPASWRGEDSEPTECQGTQQSPHALSLVIISCIWAFFSSARHFWDRIWLCSPSPIQSHENPHLSLLSAGITGIPITPGSRNLYMCVYIIYICLSVCLYLFWDRVSPCSLDQASLKLRKPPASASWKLELNACAPTLRPSTVYLCLYFHYCFTYLWVWKKKGCILL